MRDQNPFEMIAGFLFGILYFLLWLMPKTILSWIGKFIAGVFTDVHNRAVKWVGGVVFAGLLAYLTYLFIG